MPQFDRDAAKAAGYSDAEIDAYLAQRGQAAPAREMPAMRELAPRESTRVEAPAPRRAPMGAGQIAKGVARAALGQGAAFGFGDEAEALATSLATGRPYEEVVRDIRGEMGEFREQYPKAAFLSELGGGALTGGVGAGVKAAGMAGRTIPRRMLEMAGRSAVPGAIAGAGQAEEGKRLAGALTGGTVAGGIGAFGPAVTRLMGTASRMGARPDAVAEEIASLSLRGGVPVEELGARAARAAQIAPETRVGDIIGRPAMRRLRGIAALGGEPGERVEQAMVERMAGRPERLQQALTQTTGRQAENILETAGDIISRRAEQADVLYEQVRKQAPVPYAKVAPYLSRPAFVKAARDAQETLANRGISLRSIDTPQGAVPELTPEFLDYVKRSLDDQLSLEAAPNRRKALGEARDEFVKILKKEIPGYEQALDAFAGESALKQALENGAGLAAKRPSPNEILRLKGEIATNSELDMFQRGYIDGLREKIDANQLKPNEIRTPKFAKTLEAVFGKEQGQLVQEALLADVALMESAAMIATGARTAPLQQDIAQELAERRPLMETLRASFEPRRAIARGVGRLESVALGQGREATRGARASALLQPASAIGPLLSRVAQEQELQRRIARRGAVATGALAQTLGGRSARSLFGEYEEPR